MSKLLTIAAALAIAVTVAVAGTTFLDWPSNGTYQSGIGPVKVVAVDILAANSNETVIVKRITPDGTSTNDIGLGTITCSNAVEQVAVSKTIWLFADDLLERSGTATGARVRLIVQQ